MMPILTRVACAFTGVVCILPWVTGLAEPNVPTAFVVIIGELFVLAAIII